MFKRILAFKSEDHSSPRLSSVDFLSCVNKDTLTVSTDKL